MNRYCIDCKKLVYRNSIRCKKCDCKFKHKNRNIYKCKCCKKSISRSSKSELCMSCFKLKNPIRYWLGKSNKNIMIKHHIDGNKKNNKDSNFLKIKQGEHRSLHWRGYEYLVIIGKVYDFLKDFCLKYKITNIKIDDGKVVHHVDCDRENNNSDNLMYLKDKEIHNKLHQEAYRYLVRTNKVNDYIKWFFL